MATTKMSELGWYDILVREGIHPPVTMRENGGEVFPGMAVTCEGETFPDVCLPDAVGDSVAGCAGLLENQDIDTVYATDEEIPVYTTGSGAIVRMFHAANGGSCVLGQIMIAQTVEAAGYIETLDKGLEALVDDYESTLLVTVITNIFSLLGRAQETHASTGTVTPIKVILSI